MIILSMKPGFYRFKCKQYISSKRYSSHRGYTVLLWESIGLHQKSPFHYTNRGVQPLLKERKGDFMAQKANDLAHTKWMCKYHIVFTPKYRRKIIYNQLKADIRDMWKRPVYCCVKFQFKRVSGLFYQNDRKALLFYDR